MSVLLLQEIVRSNPAPASKSALVRCRGLLACCIAQLHAVFMRIWTRNIRREVEAQIAVHVLNATKTDGWLRLQSTLAGAALFVLLDRSMPFCFDLPTAVAAVVYGCIKNVQSLLTFVAVEL